MALCATVAAQQYAFRHLSTAEGLLSDFRLNIAEDRHGRLWISSDEGLNVYDGKEMNAYSKPGNSGLLTNRIEAIFCDRRGTIWIATPAGVQYRRETDAVFKKLRADSALNDALFFENAPGEGLLITTSKGCYYVDPQFRVGELKGIGKAYEDLGTPYVLYHFAGDQYLFGFGRRLALIDVRQQRVVKEYAYRQAWCVAKVTDSTFMAGSFTKDSMVIINVKTGGIESINEWPTSDGQRIAGFAGSIVPIGSSKYAVGCRLYGVYIIDVANGSAEHLVHDAGDAQSLAASYCRNLFVSSKGMLFVHTRGLSYTNVRPFQMGTVRRLLNAKGEVYDGGFTSFAEAEPGNLWIGTNRFLAHYNRKTGAAEYFPFYDRGGGMQKFRTVRTVVADAAGNPWIGSFGAGMGKLQKTKTWKYFLPDKGNRDHTIPGTEVNAMVKTPDGDFLVCTLAGFARFDPETETFTTYYKHPVLDSIAGKITYGALEDRDGNLWLAQSNGLYCYKKAANTLTRVALPQEWASPLMSAVVQDSSGTIYAGGNEGLLLIDPNTCAVKRVLDKTDGLAGNTIMSLLADRQNNIWILGNRGMARYRPPTGTLSNFGAPDGAAETNHGLCNLYQTKSGEILAGSFTGFNFFYPQNIKSVRDSLDVFVSAIELPDTLIITPLAGPLALRAADRNISFSYLAADYNPGAAIKYRYQLVGFDTGFVSAGRQRKAKYTNLPAGSYTFLVEASSNGYDWYRSGSEIHLTLPPVFYRTWWFLGSALLLLAGTVYGGFRRRVGLVRRQAQLESEREIKLNELENSSLRTQMNPHFIFNSLNTINAFINSNEKGQANQYISKFSKLIRLILDHSRQRTVTLSEELEALKLYVDMEQIRFDNRFSFSVFVSPDVDVHDTEIPSLIFQPFVENAILHGLLPMSGPGVLSLHISRKANYLFCVIEDNGIGRVRAGEERRHRLQNKKSHGLEITLKRMDLFNRSNGVEGSAVVTDLYDAAGGAAGTRVELLLALSERF